MDRWVVNVHIDGWMGWRLFIFSDIVQRFHTLRVALHDFRRHLRMECLILNSKKLGHFSLNCFGSPRHIKRLPENVEKIEIINNSYTYRKFLVAPSGKV